MEIRYDATPCLPVDTSKTRKQCTNQRCLLMLECKLFQLFVNVLGRDPKPMKPRKPSRTQHARCHRTTSIAAIWVLTQKLDHFDKFGSSWYHQRTETSRSTRSESYTFQRRHRNVSLIDASQLSSPTPSNYPHDCST